MPGEEEAPGAIPPGKASMGEGGSKINNFAHRIDYFHTKVMFRINDFVRKLTTKTPI